MSDTEASGNHVATVRVEIDYAILQHFSQHLYSSPNKAVEELVTNGYDALAQQVRVHLPGVVTNSTVLVWDDGDSMNIEGIKHLWWIAKSPKADGTERIARSFDGKRTRAMIGKFGIGKLASYAVGRTISHLCHRDGHYYLIAVDYGLAPKIEPNDSDSRRSFEVPVSELSEPEARTYAESLFRVIPKSFSAAWNKPSWTLAIIDRLKPDISLTSARLGWVLGNGMPSRPDFKVYVDDAEVKPKIEKDPIAVWDASSKDIKKRLGTDWKEVRQAGVFAGDLTFSDSVARGKTVTFPVMGEVSFEVRLYDRSLFQKGRTDAGRSEGFFILVRDRLLNSDDPKLFLHEPSYGVFNRMQIVIRADGLDNELLADRERLHRASPAGRELEFLQVALYRAARQRLTAVDSSSPSAPHVAELPITTREMVREPLTALILSDPNADLSRLDPSKTRLAIEPNGSSEVPARLDIDDNRIVTNTDHPLFTTMVDTFGRNKNSRQAQKLVEMYAIADLLLKGHLLDAGVDSELIDRVMAWRESLLRSLATTFKDSPDLIIKEVADRSYKGGSAFEQALAKLFTIMGFKTKVDGASGKKDVMVVAPVGENELRFTVEAKGSKHPLKNDAAEISGAAAHAKETGASFAVVISREFAGFARSSADAEPAILQECRTQDPPVAILAVDSLIELYRAVQEFHYPLTAIAEVLRAIESPNDKEKRIAQMFTPLETSVDWREVLEILWEKQQGTASGEPVAMLELRQSKPEWKKMVAEDFNQVLFGLEALSGQLVRVTPKLSLVNMRQSPDVVSERIASSLATSHGTETV
ncbi:ATP-binding protein [Actinosynnema sp. NPDC020468]|uniref:ATP-binding protein n=1 Tax=Actinosynnema sp. NPDC020468 TaxID=3154488 RepID=UPI00340D3F6B